MHKCSESYPDLIKSWKEGWKDYIHIPSADSRPIAELAKTCAMILRVDLDVQPGYIRVMAALKNIAAHCSNHPDWRDKNLYSINQAISTIMQQMTAAKKLQKEVEHDRSGADRIYLHQKSQREKAEDDMRRERERLRKEFEQNWTEEQEREYQAYMKSITPSKVISMTPADDQAIKKAK